MGAPRLSPGLEVAEVNDRVSLAVLAPEWNALVELGGDQVFYRHEFFRTWIDNFAPNARLRILIAREKGGRLAAVLPLMETREPLYGVPVTQLTSTANAHSCRFDLIARDDSTAARAGWAFLDHLSQDRRWDVLKLTDVPEGGRAWSLFEAARQAGLPTGEWASLRSPYLPLPGDFETLKAGLHAKFRANLRRRRRKLEERGEVQFERYTGGEALEARLEEGLELERSGWKGRRGTAIAQDVASRGFYSELARTAAHQGELCLSFLRLSGRPVAFHYALLRAGRYLLLKPGYDEALGECSPGQLLMEQVLQDAVGRGLSEVDFLGPDMVWKRDWTDRVRGHTWLYVFRDSPVGRTLRAAKFRWVPAARTVVNRWTR